MKFEISELQRFFEVMEEKNLSITEVIASIQCDNESIKSKPLDKEFDLSVDYSRTVQEMINAGNYNRVNNDITAEHFPLPNERNGKKVTVSTKLFHFNRVISSKDAIVEMDKAGYRSATLTELLALGEVYPELQKEFPIVTLGSVWRNANDSRFVPVLFFDDYGRRLILNWFDGDWSGICRFLGVRR